MRWTARAYDPTGGMLPRGLKWLLVANGAVFALQLLTRLALGRDVLVYVFGLQPATVILRGWVWQPVTYMFLHAGFLHLAFNLFVLWMFGMEIERLWGRREFLRYYFVCGLGAAALSFLFGWNSIVIGASGAVLGVLLAFGILFPDRYIYLWFLIPIRAKYLVAGIAALELLFLATRAGGPIANAAHVGGMLAGWVYLKWGRGGGGPMERFAARWRRRRLEVVEGGRGKSDAGTEAAIDRILDKISEQGIESLTPEETRILDEASRRHRPE